MGSFLWKNYLIFRADIVLFTANEILAGVVCILKIDCLNPKKAFSFGFDLPVVGMLQFYEILILI